MGGENTTQNDQSPRKQQASAGGGGDRLKRDEWSEGAVTELLEAYESKWVLRNRAKLKGHDWEDVSRCVSSRGNNSKSPKTQTQCKNKIESMKKRYRSESAAQLSSWPLFSRLDHLLRGTNPPPPPQPLQLAAVVESSTMAVPTLQAPVVLLAQNQSQESTDVDAMVKENEGMRAKPCDQVTDKNNKNDHDNHQETDSSTPAVYSSDRVKTTMKRKRRRRGKSRGLEEVSESMRWLVDTVVRSEQARMDTLRDVERMRVEAEAKRGEMDVKRTEIIANTQLEIARLFAAVAGKKC